MEPVPEPLSESQILLLWAFAYLLLGFVFTVMGWILLFKSKYLLSFIAFMGGFLASLWARKRASLAEIYNKDINDR